MLNFREIDKFCLSGGWNNLKKNAEFLQSKDVKAVLDLQYTSWDDSSLPKRVRSYLEGQGIEYRYILLEDSDLVQNFEDILDEGYAHLLELSNSTITTTKTTTGQTRDKGKILVKCAAGISRSPSMLAYYYGRKNDWTYDEAISYIWKREAHKAAYHAAPNYFFAMTLRRLLGSAANKARYEDVAYGRNDIKTL